VSSGFANRAEAGRSLAQRLAAYANRPDAVLLAHPRGGVPVAFEIARSLGLPLDVLLVRKLGVPGYEELAFGAVAGGVRILDPDIIEGFALSPQAIDRVVAVAEAELVRRDAAFRAGRPPLPLQGRTAILVDDGIATGSTMRAAIAATRRLGATRVVVAAGVAPLQTSMLLSSEADEVICLLTPREFRSVSLFYDAFPQLTDDDVRDFLHRAQHAKTSGPSGQS
jgi:predicted phosphoribosyltransferase